MVLSLSRLIRDVLSNAPLLARYVVRFITRPAPVVGGLIEDVTRSRKELIAENALLRQQLIVAARAVGRPKFRAGERGLLVLLARLVPRWRDAVLLVRPETILRWHRYG